jgi:hypothetical protein
MQVQHTKLTQALTLNVLPATPTACRWVPEATSAAAAAVQGWHLRMTKMNIHDAVTEQSSHLTEPFLFLATACSQQ